MRTFGRSVFLHCSKAASVTSRTAVYGPVRTVVWQGSAGDCRPYADQTPQCPGLRLCLDPIRSELDFPGYFRIAGRSLTDRSLDRAMTNAATNTMTTVEPTNRGSQAPPRVSHSANTSQRNAAETKYQRLRRLQAGVLSVLVEGGTIFLRSR